MRLKLNHLFGTIIHFFISRIAFLMIFYNKIASQQTRLTYLIK